MSKQTITPGPWRLLKHPSFRRNAYIVDGPPQSHASVFWNEADARAIACLPELLGAAKGLLAECRKLTHGYVGAESKLERLQAVVERMEGKS